MVSTYYLGGMTVTDVGWIGPTSVYVDFVSQYDDDDGWLWQLYANRTLIGVTRAVTERRIVGQLVDSATPAWLTLLRVAASSVLTDFGAQIPAGPFNRYRLDWTPSGSDADLHHWDVTMGAAAGEDPDPENVIARVPFHGDRAYSFNLPPFETPGTWTYAITPRDDALPLGNAGTPVEVAIVAAVPPPDLAFEDDEPRFTASVTSGVLTVEFAWS